jgi:hypothetical protein
MLAPYSSAAFTNASGLAVAANAAIEVRLDGPGGGAIAAIFSDEEGANPITQPGFQADANGRFNFYAVGRMGGYRIKVTKDAFEYELRHVPIGTAGFLDSSEVGEDLVTAADKAAGREAIDAAAKTDAAISLQGLFGVI